MRFLLCLAKLRRNSQAQDSARLCWTLRCLAQAWSKKRVQKLCIFTETEKTLRKRVRPGVSTFVRFHSLSHVVAVVHESVQQLNELCWWMECVRKRIFHETQHSLVAMFHMTSFSCSFNTFFISLPAVAKHVTCHPETVFSGCFCERFFMNITL